MQSASSLCKAPSPIACSEDDFPDDTPAVILRFNPGQRKMVTLSQCLSEHADDVDFDETEMVVTFLS